MSAATSHNAIASLVQFYGTELEALVRENTLLKVANEALKVAPQTGLRKIHSAMDIPDFLSDALSHAGLDRGTTWDIKMNHDGTLSITFGNQK